jgi:hypothetical protein
VKRLLGYFLALILILAVLATLVHHTNFEGLMLAIHGG